MNESLICPYCGKEQDDVFEVFRNGVTDTNLQCQFCDKWMRATVEYTASFESFELPCLNDGAKHSWSKWISWGDELKRRYCKHCDKYEYTPKPEERAELEKERDELKKKIAEHEPKIAYSWPGGSCIIKA